MPEIAAYSYEDEDYDGEEVQEGGCDVPDHRGIPLPPSRGVDSQRGVPRHWYDGGYGRHYKHYSDD